MLTLLTTDEFAVWFGALDDASAEEVAAGLELLRELGPEREPPRSRDLLLWYQAAPEQRTGVPWLEGDFFAFAQRVRSIVTHLESERVQKQLLAAPFDAQHRVSTSLAAIRVLAHPRRIFAEIQRQGTDTALRDLQRHYASILEVVDVPPLRHAPYGNELHELNFPSCQPALRVLYGVDQANAHALLVLGESLDRRAFGPSVRRALRVWNAYLSGENREHTAELRQKP